MKKKIYAKTANQNILERLNRENRVHSIFKNGINIECSSGLVFIGRDKNGKLPFGIHLDDEDMEELVNIEKNTVFKFNKTFKTLETSKYIIDFNKVELYSSKLPRVKKDIGDIEFTYLLNTIREMNLFTGLDMTIEDMLLDKEGLIYKLRTSIVSKDEEYIKEVLRKIIGRGKGLTPSGDDLLIGLLWINDTRKILSNEFIKSLEWLIFQGGLTTDVSVNYYKSTLLGDYSSNLIDLSYGLIEFDKGKIKSILGDIIQYGHTSGVDLLSGISLGLTMIK